MSDEVKPERCWPWRRMRPWELASCTLCVLMFGLITVPNFVRAGGSYREPVPLTIMGVSFGFAVLCFVRCPLRHWVAKAVLGFMLCGSLAVYVPLLAHRGCGRGVNACLANLKQIEGAKANWAQEEHKATNDIPLAAQLYGTNGYILREPKCPEGGTYKIGKVGEIPRCSIAGHSLG